MAIKEICFTAFFSHDGFDVDEAVIETSHKLLCLDPSIQLPAGRTFLGGVRSKIRVIRHLQSAHKNLVFIDFFISESHFSLKKTGLSDVARVNVLNFKMLDLDLATEIRRVCNIESDVRKVIASTEIHRLSALLNDTRFLHFDAIKYRTHTRAGVVSITTVFNLRRINDCQTFCGSPQFFDDFLIQDNELYVHARQKSHTNWRF